VSPTRRRRPADPVPEEAAEAVGTAFGELDEAPAPPDEPAWLRDAPGVDDDPAYAARAHRLGAEAWIAKDRAEDPSFARG